MLKIIPHYSVNQEFVTNRSATVNHMDNADPDHYDDIDEEFDQNESMSKAALIQATNTHGHANHGPLEPNNLTKQTFGKWKMTNGRNLQKYYQSLGVNGLMAGMAAGVRPTMEITATKNGIKQVTKTGGFFSRTITQEFVYGEKTEFNDPLTGHVKLCSMDQSGRKFRKTIYEDQGRLPILISKFTLTPFFGLRFFQSLTFFIRP